MKRLPLAAFIALSVLYIGAMSIQLPGIHDEGLIVSGATRMLQGLHPYTDFNTGYPPGQFLTVAALFRLFGTTLLAERIWDTLWRFGIVAAAFWLAWELGNRKVHLLPLVCCTALVGDAGFHLYPMVTATLPCLCALASALAFVRTRDPRWIWSAGLLLGVTAAYRHDLAVCTAIPILWTVRRDWRGALRLSAAALITLGPVLLWMFTVIPMRDLREAFIEFPRINAAGRVLPLEWTDLLLPVTIIVFGLYRTRRSEGVIVAAAAGFALALSLQRFDGIHDFAASILCTVILAAVGQKLLIAVAFVFLGLAPIRDWASEFRMIILVPPSGIERAGPVRLRPDQSQAVRYIQQHSSPSDKLFVGTTRHSQISYNDTIFQFLAERPHATRWYMWLPGQTDTAAVQSEIVSGLERDRVPYAVLFDAPIWDEPNNSGRDSGVRILDDYLRAHYAQSAAFGSYRVLMRTPPPSPPSQ